MTGLVGFLLENGNAVCVDCDAYPPNSQNIYTNDAESVLHADDRTCSVCGSTLADVWPVGQVL